MVGVHLPRISCMAPFATVLCLGFSGAMQEQKSLERGVPLEWSLVARIKNDVPTIWATDCFFWPVANAINFSQVPLIYRPIFTSCSDLVWSTFLSYYTMHVAPAESSGGGKSAEAREAARETGAA